MPCSPSNEREQSPLFLETTIQIERVVGLPGRKEAMKQPKVKAKQRALIKEISMYNRH